MSATSIVLINLQTKLKANFTWQYVSTFEKLNANNSKFTAAAKNNYFSL
jgi:hypothetical protein